MARMRRSSEQENSSRSYDEMFSEVHNAYRSLRWGEK